jgi:hypothetical protein
MKRFPVTAAHPSLLHLKPGEGELLRRGLRKPPPRPLLRSGRLARAIARWRVRLQGRQQALRGISDFIDRPIEGGLIGLGRMGETAHLADELQRRRA